MSKKASLEVLKLLTIEEAASICGYGNEVIKQEIESGQIKIFRPFSKRFGNYKIPSTELDNWIKNNTHALQTDIKN